MDRIKIYSDVSCSPEVGYFVRTRIHIPGISWDFATFAGLDVPDLNAADNLRRAEEKCLREVIRLAEATLIRKYGAEPPKEKKRWWPFGRK